MADERDYTEVGNTYLVQKMAADDLLTTEIAARLYADVIPEPTAPDTTLYPAVVFHLQASNDVLNAGGDIVEARQLFLVRAVCRASYGALTQTARRIKAALHKQLAQTITIDGLLYRIDSFQQKSYQHTYEKSGILYRMRGGFYWVRIRPL